MSEGKRNEVSWIMSVQNVAKEFDVILNVNYNNYHYDKFIHIHCGYVKKICLFA
jgi:hypothetical protein